MEIAELKSFIQKLDPDEREPFASRCDTSAGHIRNVMYGQRPCSHALAAHIERESKRRVRRWHLCPTDWHLIWPELIAAKGAPAIPTPERKVA